MRELNYWNGDGVETLGDATAASDTPWWQNVITGITQIGTSAAQIEAMRQQAKTGQVPQAQLNVGLETGTRNTMLMVIGGGIAVLAAVMLLKR